MTLRRVSLLLSVVQLGTSQPATSPGVNQQGRMMKASHSSVTNFILGYNVGYIKRSNDVTANFSQFLIITYVIMTQESLLKTTLPQTLPVNYLIRRFLPILTDNSEIWGEYAKPDFNPDRKMLCRFNEPGIHIILEKYPSTFSKTRNLQIF